MPSNGTQKYRIEQLERRCAHIDGKLEDKYNQLDDKVDTIMTNHLPHIREDIIRLRTTIKTATALNIGALILLAVLSRQFG